MSDNYIFFMFFDIICKWTLFYFLKKILLKALQPRRVGDFLTLSTARKKGETDTFHLEANNLFRNISFASKKHFLHASSYYSMNYGGFCCFLVNACINVFIICTIKVRACTQAVTEECLMNLNNFPSFFLVFKTELLDLIFSLCYGP